MSQKLLNSKQMDALKHQRWFQHKEASIERFELVDWVKITDAQKLGIFSVHAKNMDPEFYLVPFSGEPEGSEEIMVHETFLGETINPLIDHILRSSLIKTQNGSIQFKKVGDWDIDVSKVRAQEAGINSTNTIIFGEGGGKKFALKILRHLSKGENVEASVNNFLFTKTNFRAAPSFWGMADYLPQSGARYHIANIFEYQENEGSAWDFTQKWLADFIQNKKADIGKYCSNIETLGKDLASLHIALSSGERPFDMEPVAKNDIYTLHHNWINQSIRTFELIERYGSKISGLDELMSSKDAIQAVFDKAARAFSESGCKIRQHADFHLGQALVHNEKFYIIDFEGEPLKPYSERSAHYPALKDVAGMLRSFNYASFAAYFDAQKKPDGAKINSTTLDKLRDWEKRSCKAFLNGYYAQLKECKAKFLPFDKMDCVEALLKALKLEKALYEFEYEIGNRPDWVQIPVSGITELLEEIK